MGRTLRPQAGRVEGTEAKDDCLPSLTLGCMWGKISLSLSLFFCLHLWHLEVPRPGLHLSRSSDRCCSCSNARVGTSEGLCFINCGHFVHVFLVHHYFMFNPTGQVVDPQPTLPGGHRRRSTRGHGGAAPNQMAHKRNGRGHR